MNEWANCERHHYRLIWNRQSCLLCIDQTGPLSNSWMLPAPSCFMGLWSFLFFYLDSPFHLYQNSLLPLAWTKCCFVPKAFSASSITTDVNNHISEGSHSTLLMSLQVLSLFFSHITIKHITSFFLDLSSLRIETVLYSSLCLRHICFFSLVSHILVGQSFFTEWN